MPDKLIENIKRIREYTENNPELKRSHHFTYDLPANDKPVEFVVMGINPGEPKWDWDHCQGPTEETRLFDFQEKFGRSPASKRWYKKVDFYLSGRGAVMTECFFWSSKDVDTLEELYGPLENSTHIEFCKAMNDDILDRYKPRAIVFPGLRYYERVRQLYGIGEHVKTVPGSKGRLIEHYKYGATPWVFTKHWSGAWMEKGEPDQIRDYLAGL